MASPPTPPIKIMQRPPEGAIYERELDGISDVLYMAMHRAIDDSNLARSCINCHFFKEHDGEICTMYGNARPPARIIARGCQGHSKEIPF